MPVTKDSKTFFITQKEGLFCRIIATNFSKSFFCTISITKALLLQPQISHSYEKNLLALTTFFCVSTVAINAQNTFPANGSVGIGTTAPNTSALLDVTSTSRGLLIPRMTQAQRNAIVSPATGLFIYQTNGTAGFYYYSGTTWTPVSGKGANTSLSNLVTTSIKRCATSEDNGYL